MRPPPCKTLQKKNKKIQVTDRHQLDPTTRPRPRCCLVREILHGLNFATGSLLSYLPTHPPLCRVLVGGSDSQQWRPFLMFTLVHFSSPSASCSSPDHPMPRNHPWQSRTTVLRHSLLTMPWGRESPRIRPGPSALQHLAFRERSPSSPATRGRSHTSGKPGEDRPPSAQGQHDHCTSGKAVYVRL